MMGTSTEPWALDNERPAHLVELGPFYIDTTPVTNARYAEFIADGGYDQQRWWSPAGWEHRQRAGLDRARVLAARGGPVAAAPLRDHRAGAASRARAACLLV